MADAGERKVKTREFEERWARFRRNSQAGASVLEGHSLSSSPNAVFGMSIGRASTPTLTPGYNSSGSRNAKAHELPPEPHTDSIFHSSLRNLAGGSQPPAFPPEPHTDSIFHSSIRNVAGGSQPPEFPPEPDSNPPAKNPPEPDSDPPAREALRTRTGDRASARSIVSTRDAVPRMPVESDKGTVEERNDGPCHLENETVVNDSSWSHQVMITPSTFPAASNEKVQEPAEPNSPPPPELYSSMLEEMSQAAAARAALKQKLVEEIWPTEKEGRPNPRPASNARTGPIRASASPSGGQAASARAALKGVLDAEASFTQSSRTTNVRRGSAGAGAERPPLQGIQKENSTDSLEGAQGLQQTEPGTLPGPGNDNGTVEPEGFKLWWSVDDPTEETIIFCGNPGSGKSTLLNGLVGSVAFSAGFATDGTGVTKQFQHKVVGSRKLCDTPGLDDPRLRKVAAEEITSALRSCPNVMKLVFICTMRSGRIHGNDLNTIRAVLEAMEAQDMTIENSYGVVFNMLLRKEMETYNSPGGLQVLRTLLPDGKQTSQILLLPKDAELEEADGSTIPPRYMVEKMQMFILGMPAYRSNAQKVQAVKHEDWSQSLDAMETEFQNKMDLVHGQLQSFRDMAQEEKEKNRRLQLAMEEDQRAMLRAQEKLLQVMKDQQQAAVQDRESQDQLVAELKRQVREAMERNLALKDLHNERLERQQQEWVVKLRAEHDARLQKQEEEERARKEEMESLHLQRLQQETQRQAEVRSQLAQMREDQRQLLQQGELKRQAEAAEMEASRLQGEVLRMKQWREQAVRERMESDRRLKFVEATLEAEKRERAIEAWQAQQLSTESCVVS